jgi:hypothetical protein
MLLDLEDKSRKFGVMTCRFITVQTKLSFALYCTAAERFYRVVFIKNQKLKPTEKSSVQAIRVANVIKLTNKLALILK